MKKSIILLGILALLILIAPFVIGKLANTPIEEPVPEATPEPTAEPTPLPTMVVVEIVLLQEDRLPERLLRFHRFRFPKARHLC